MSDLESGATASAKLFIGLLAISLKHNVVVNSDCGVAGERLFTLDNGVGDVGSEAV